MNDAPMDWAETRRRFARDYERLCRFQISKFGYAPLTMFLDPSWMCVLFYRLSHLSYRSGHRRWAKLFMQLNSMWTGADIMPPSDVGGGLLVPTPCGVNISGKVGENLTALALCGIGGSVRNYDIGAGIGLPVLGNDVSAGPFTGIQGPIRLGDDCDIGPCAGAVVDVPAGSRMAVAMPAQVGVDPSVPDAHDLLKPPCRHASWRETRAAFDADVNRFLAEADRYVEAGQPRAKRRGAVLSNPQLALYVYRLSHWLFLNGHRRSSHLLCLLNFFLHKVMIPPASCLGGGVLLPHLGGTLFVGRGGDNLTLYASSLCAPFRWERSFSPDSGPTIGDDVLIGGQCAAVGAIEIGDRVQLGPKAHTYGPVPPDTQVWSTTGRGTIHPKAEQEPAAENELPPARPKLPFPTWRETKARLRRDRGRLKELRGQGPTPVSRLLLVPAFLCVALHRLSHHFHAAGHRRMARWCWLANCYLTGADIAPSAEIGGGLLVPHPAGIAIYCRAGSDLTILAQSGIGNGLAADGTMKPLDQAPQLGDRVTLSHHCGVYGAITIGNGVRIEPSAVALHSVADGLTLVPRAQKFRKRSVAVS
jgi:serine O-acetyltransferase